MISPPIKNIAELLMHRAAYSDEVNIYIGADVYSLNYQDARKWFLQVCNDSFLLEKVFSYLWNFRALKYYPQEKIFIPASAPKE